MFTEKCLIDGKEFTYLTIGTAKKVLRGYIEKTFDISYENYILEFFYNNEKPLCACGCGTETEFFKGKYYKYYKDHKNKTKQSQETKEKIKQIRIRSHNFEDRLKKLLITYEQMEIYYDKYINFEIDRETMIQETCLDFRTIKSVWREMEVIKNEEDFRRITKKHQYFWNKKKNSENHKHKIEDEILINVMIFLKQEKGKYTLKEIKHRFNIEFSTLVIYRRLVDKFSDKIVDECLRIGNSSNAELEFGNVLKYYFGKDVKTQVKIENKFYDFKIKNLLIEFDGEYWHSLLKNIENDKNKDEIAIRNGYKIFRVKEKECKDIEILLKIKKEAYEN